MFLFTNKNGSFGSSPHQDFQNRMNQNRAGFKTGDGVPRFQA